MENNNSRNIESGVLVYARASTLKQDYQRQIDEITSVCNSRGWNILEVFHEKISGMLSNKKRPEMSKLIEYIHNNPGKVKKVCVWEISRLGRKAIEVKQTIDEFTQAGISCFIYNIGLETLNKDGKPDYIVMLILSILAEIGQMERELTLERIKSGLNRSANQGKAGGGQLINYGFERDSNGYYKRIEEEIEVVLSIINESLGGKGSQTIADMLNERGVPTKSNKVLKKKVTYHNRKKYAIEERKPSDYKWSGKVVLDILKNPIYKGYRKFKGRLIKTNGTAIIDEAKWQLVQDNLRKNYNESSRNTRHFYLLDGLLKCSVCGRNYKGRMRSDLSDNFYQCTSRHRNECTCGNSGIGIPDLNVAIWQTMRNYHHVKKYIKKNYLNTDGKLISQIESEIEALEVDSKRVHAKLSNLISLQASQENFSIDIVNKEIRRAKRKVEKNSLRISELNFQKEKELSKNKDEALRSLEVIAKVEKNDPEVKRILNSFIEEIQITNIYKDEFRLIVLIFKNTSGAFPIYLNTKSKEFRVLRMDMMHSVNYSNELVKAIKAQRNKLKLD